jgi:thiol-disulfide isomerase/thioredoxin
MRKWISVLLPALVVGCGPSADRGAHESTEPSLVTGPWRAEVEHFGRTLPFNFEFVDGPDGLQAFYLNGPERLPVEQVLTGDDGTLQLNFPSYASGLTATVDGKRMRGEISLQRRSEITRLPFSATQGLSYRFYPEPSVDYADFSGRWKVEIFVPKFDFRQPAIALFEQDGPFVSGTVFTQVGDYRFLYGEARGKTLSLSTFDGSGTQLWLAELDADGRLAGSFDSVTYKQAEWSAERDTEFELEDPTTLTYLKDGFDAVTFSFPDLDGEMISLPGDRFDGKVVLVILGGSWCPTCHDEAQFLVPFLASRQQQGLEAVYIMFEYSDDFEAAKPQLLAYQQRYAIEHPIVFAGDSSRESRAEKLPMLNDVMAFPTTIFVDRRGKVRRIHTAFPGPATGQEHEDYKREFTAFVDLLLDEDA